MQRTDIANSHTTHEQPKDRSHIRRAPFFLGRRCYGLWPHSIKSAPCLPAHQCVLGRSDMLLCLLYLLDIEVNLPAGRLSLGRCPAFRRSTLVAFKPCKTQVNRAWRPFGSLWLPVGVLMAPLRCPLAPFGSHLDRFCSDFLALAPF